jgi:ParB family transcriptional regulator, chromosome partitioning protein
MLRSIELRFDTVRKSIAVSRLATIVGIGGMHPTQSTPSPTPSTPTHSGRQASNARYSADRGGVATTGTAASADRGGVAQQEFRDLPVSLIEPNLSQPRRYFDEGTLQELADSASERGVLQPVLVRPQEDGRYELVAGERRWRAAKIAGLERIPALVSRYDDLAAFEVGLIENMAREDLNPVEEARACERLVREFGLSHGQIADRVGRDRSRVAHLIRLLNLSEEILELMERGKLSAAHGRALLTVNDPRVRTQLASAAVKGAWSVQALEARARDSNSAVSGAAASPPGQVGDERGSEQDATLMNVARVWGDALGVEVQIRSFRGRKLRVELPFGSAEAALGFGGLIGERIARGRKRD